MIHIAHHLQGFNHFKVPFPLIARLKWFPSFSYLEKIFRIQETVMARILLWCSSKNARAAMSSTFISSTQSGSYDSPCFIGNPEFPNKKKLTKHLSFTNLQIWYWIRPKNSTCGGILCQGFPYHHGKSPGFPIVPSGKFDFKNGWCWFWNQPIDRVHLMIILKWSLIETSS